MQAIDEIKVERVTRGSGIASTIHYQLYIGFFLTPYTLAGSGVSIPKQAPPTEVAEWLKQLASQIEKLEE